MLIERALLNDFLYFMLWTVSESLLGGYDLIETDSVISLSKFNLLQLVRLVLN